MAPLSCWFCPYERISYRIFSQVSCSYNCVVSISYHVLYPEVKNYSKGNENSLDNCWLCCYRPDNSWRNSDNRTIACPAGNCAPRPWASAFRNDISNCSIL